MAWEKRGNNSYYYRKKRIGKKVVSVYHGPGVSGSLAAAIDAEKTEERRRREEMTKIEAMIGNYMREVKAVTEGALLAAGHHQHHGQWRKQR